MVAWLESRANESVKDGMARYAIPSDKAFGIPVGVLRAEAKRLGTDHALAEALWKTGWYEARLLAAFVADPDLVTPQQMDRWCRDFDNWAICDTACFHLFDRTPHAFAMVEKWAKSREEFVRRAAFALLASLALHDEATPDAAFSRCLPLIERAANDDRNFVKKATSWALRALGGRSTELNRAALEVAKRLAARDEAAPRWIGKDALRGLQSPTSKRRLARRAQAGEGRKAQRRRQTKQL